MNMIRTILESTVPISQFNRGMAGKIFDEVKKHGAKIVMKNNEPECVLLSPEDYIALIEQVNDAKLLLLANERMEKYDANKLVSHEDVMKRYGITASDLEDCDDIEFESCGMLNNYQKHLITWMNVMEVKEN